MNSFFGVARPDQVDLVDGPGHAKGVFGDVGAQGPIRDVDVVVRALVHGDGQISGGNDERPDASHCGGICDRNVDDGFAPLLGEQLVVVQTARGTDRTHADGFEGPIETVRCVIREKSPIVSVAGITAV
jgi:hypothetical protein